MQLGVVFAEQGKTTQALGYFNKALAIDASHELSLLNSAIIIQESGQKQLHELARQRLMALIARGSSNERVHFNLGMLAMDAKDLHAGERWFREAIAIKADFRSALFNLALLLSESKRPLEAIPVLDQLLSHHHDHVKGRVLLGDIYVNHVRDLDKAEAIYKQILALNPKHVQAWHNLCVTYVEKKELSRAEQCLSDVYAESPEPYVLKHLNIVRERIAKQSKTD